MDTKNFVNGEFYIPEESTVKVYNPSNLNEKVGEIHQSNEQDLLNAVNCAQKTKKTWANQTSFSRAEILYQMADRLKENIEEIAELSSREMGKPFSEMKGEVNRGIQLLKYYAGEGARSNGDIIPSSQGNVLQYSKKVPLGVVGVITPWNFPIAIPIWKIAPALICGNTVVWKPAENAALSATKLVELFEQTDLPAGVLNLVIGKGSKIGKAMIEESEVNAISFTGSDSTGKYVATESAKRNIKFQTEMGGKNVAIVMEDADLEIAVPALLSGAFTSAGQKCTATSRILVHQNIFDDLRQSLIEALDNIKLDDALNKDTFIGPVASKEQFDKVNDYLNLAQKKGKIIAEKDVVTGLNGYFIPPTIVAGVDANSRLVKEEIFGPIATIMTFKSFEEAIHLANDSEFGLSASIFTKHLNYANRFLDELEAGMVRVNQETAGVEFQAPFGGMKNSSSHSREQGQAALDFYTQIKTCAIKY